MGASKRLAELLLQSMQKDNTKFMAVRFGNVVGSSGSVIPLFRRQIEYGGPITVTHPEVRRYFMTIPEAAQLIMQAAAIGKGGEIFVLQMGTPVKILDLAKDLIRLSGREHQKDINIIFTGLRPGEKLLEECILGNEDVTTTEHDKILVLRNNNHEISMTNNSWLSKQIEELYIMGLQMDVSGIRKKLLEIIPEYNPNSIRNLVF